ncbi:MAG: PEP-CTERM sorting domain-containing protein [Phycisphaerales bacterium]
MVSRALRFCPVLVMLACCGASMAQTQFIPLGVGDGTVVESFAWGISRDGSTVVGESPMMATGSQPQGYAYNVATQVSQVIGFLNMNNRSSVANACSDDGSVRVGFSRYADTGVFFEAYVASPNGFVTGLGDLPGGPSISNALSVSGDGSVTVGYGTALSGSNGRRAFRHSVMGGLVDLGLITGHNGYSEARGVSGDGTIVVGISTTTSGLARAFRWTSAMGMVSIGDLAGGEDFSEALAISSDGSTIVGNSVNEEGGVAFRWTSESGMVSIGDLPGGLVQASARAVNSDGSVIVGEGIATDDIFDSEAFIWDSTNGMRSIRSVLTGAGIDLTGWTLSSATGVSGDGRRIVGNGINPMGQSEAFLVILNPDAPPCPVDFNGDGFVEPGDLDDFITSFFSDIDEERSRTDFNGDGFVEPGDLDEFITAFFDAPC